MPIGYGNEGGFVYGLGGNGGGSTGYTPPGDRASIGGGDDSDDYYSGDRGLGGGYVPDNGGGYTPPGDGTSLLDWVKHKRDIDYGYNPNDDTTGQSFLDQVVKNGFSGGSKRDYDVYKEGQNTGGNGGDDDAGNGSDDDDFRTLPVVGNGGGSGAEELAEWFLQQQTNGNGNGAGGGTGNRLTDETSDDDDKTTHDDKSDAGNWWDIYGADSDFMSWLTYNKGMQFGAGFSFENESQADWDSYYAEYKASLGGESDGDTGGGGDGEGDTGEGDTGDDDTGDDNWWNIYATDNDFHTWLKQNKGMQFGAGFNFANENKDVWDTYWSEYQQFLDEGPPIDDTVDADDDDDYVDTWKKGGTKRAPLDLSGYLEWMSQQPGYNPLGGGVLKSLGQSVGDIHRDVDMPWTRPTAGITTSDVSDPAEINLEGLLSGWEGYSPRRRRGGVMPFYSQGSMQDLLRQLSAGRRR
jgi:hypothetical protein